MKVYRHQAEDMAQAHAEGYHTPPDGLPREGCPECEGRDLRDYPIDPVRTDQSKTVGPDGRLRYSADGSEVFPGATGVRR